MKKLAFIIACLLVLSSAALAEGVTAVVEGDAEVSISVSEATAEAPALGQWSETACLVGAEDDEARQRLRTTIAIRATDLDFNNYAEMSYDDKVSVVIALVCAPYTDEMHAMYGERAPGDIIMYTEPAGEYALFVFEDGQWGFRSAFALESGEIVKKIITVGVEGLDAPAFLAKLDPETGEWHAVGVNQPYAELLIDTNF